MDSLEQGETPALEESLLAASLPSLSLLAQRDQESGDSSSDEDDSLSASQGLSHSQLVRPPDGLHSSLGQLSSVTFSIET